MNTFFYKLKHFIFKFDSRSYLDSKEDIAKICENISHWLQLLLDQHTNHNYVIVILPYGYVYLIKPCIVNFDFY